MVKKQQQAAGTCKYCGQTALIYLPEGWDSEDENIKEKCDEMATEQCECERGRKEKEKDQQREEALICMEKYYEGIILGLQQGLLTPESEREIEMVRQQKNLIKNVVSAVCDNTARAASIALSDSESFLVCKKANGDLQIKRTSKNKVEWIF